MTVAEILEQVKRLSLAEQQELIGHLARLITIVPDAPLPHHISDLRGLGVERWQNTDVHAYVAMLRDEWEQ